MSHDVAEAACSVVEDGHLLVLTHDDVALTATGVQVPAGSIEAGGRPEQAAEPELLEETGRHGHVMRVVGIRRYDPRPGRDGIAVRHDVEMRRPDADVTERWAA